MSSISPLSGLLTVSHLRFTNLWLSLGIFLIGFATLMSLISVPDPLKAVILNDKLTHVAAYGCLMGWFAQIFRHDLTRAALVVLFVVLGVGMEYLQSMVPSRHFEVADMLANTCGILLAWALSYTRMGELLQMFEDALMGGVVQSA